MSTVLVIARREWLGLFATLFAWSLLALVQIILGVFFFLNQLDAFINTQPLLIAMNSRFGITAFVVAPIYESASMLLMFVIPLICMNAIAGERRGASLPLLFSAPVSMRAIVLGKYLALFAFMTLMCILISTLPLSLLLAANLDTGLVAAASLGLLLTAASYTAACLYISSLTTQPSLASNQQFCFAGNA